MQALQRQNYNASPTTLALQRQSYNASPTTPAL